MPRIYVAMSCCGKSYYRHHHHGGYDMHVFHRPMRWMWETLKAESNDVIFINPFDDFEQLFIENGIEELTLILPSPEMKAEILERADHKQTEYDEWPEVYSEIYDTFWNMVNNTHYPRIYLQPGTYVSDIIDDNGDIKEGVEVIVPNKE